MVYDEDLADRIRLLLQAEGDVTEKRMFGGLAFLVGGNLAVAASGRGGIMVRVDPRETETLVADPHVSRMVMRGREMDGWIRVADEGLAEDDELHRWVALGTAYAKTLPPK
jgi:TfoX/Sxy family transcriptional regulator of competence genes